MAKARSKALEYRELVALKLIADGITSMLAATQEYNRMLASGEVSLRNGIAIVSGDRRTIMRRKLLELGLIFEDGKNLRITRNGEILLQFLGQDITRYPRTIPVENGVPVLKKRLF